MLGPFSWAFWGCKLPDSCWDPRQSLQGLWWPLASCCGPSRCCLCMQDLKGDLIYTRISGYGQTGPKAVLPGYASVCEAYGGFRCPLQHAYA